MNSAPLLNIDAATIHVATVLIEQGYKADDAYQAAERIVYKCTAKLAAEPLRELTPTPIEETAPLLKICRRTNAL